MGNRAQAPWRTRGSITLAHVMRATLLGVVLLLFVRRFVPSIPLSLLTHEAVEAPDPTQECFQELLLDHADIEGPNGRPARLTPRARFELAARVASITRYRLDAAAFVIPWDVAVMWGDLCGPPYSGKLTYHQNARFYFWATNDLSLSKEYIVRHSANVHVIPATPRLASVLSYVRAGDVVELAGRLVDIHGTGRKEGFTWPTSLRRDDTDKGACETIYLESLTVGNRRYR